VFLLVLFLTGFFPSPEIPTQPTLDPSYTSSPDIPHQDSSSNEEIHGVSFEEPLYLIPKTEVNQLHHHTQAYLKSFGQIPIIYEIPRSRVSQRITQPYNYGETPKYSISNLIIDTISEIHQPITDIAHSKTSEDLEFQNLADFQEKDLAFVDFPEAQVGGSRPLEPPETNPPLNSIPYP
jgi:hypothetical protein